MQAADACNDPSVSFADSSPYAGEPWCGHLLCMLRISRQAFCLCRLKLGLVELAVEAIGGHEAVVGALLHHPAVPQNQNVVG